MIKRAHIQQFLAIVETGTFTQAAQRLRVTQPTLSLGIAELERLCGNRLFVRSRRHVQLTDAGARFLPIARDLQRGFRVADAFGNIVPAHWPQLRLGVIRTLAAPMLARIVGTLAAKYTIEIFEGTDAELRSAMSGGRIDMAVGLLRPGEAGETIFPLLEEPYVMLVAQDHRLAGKDEASPAEVSSEVMIARRSCEVLDQTSRIFTKYGIRPRFAFRSDSDERCLIMVEAGIGVTTAPRSFTRSGIVPIAVRGYDLTRRLGLRVEAAWLSSTEDLVQGLARAMGAPPATAR